MSLSEKGTPRLAFVGYKPAPKLGAVPVRVSAAAGRSGSPSGSGLALMARPGRGPGDFALKVEEGIVN